MQNENSPQKNLNSHAHVGKRRILLSATILLLIFIVLGILAYSPAATTVSSPSPLLGKTAPNFGGVGIVGGKDLTLSQYRGKFVVLNFFASWCNPCFQESPALVSFAYEHHSDNIVKILGVVFSDSSKNAANFLKSVGATWNAINDTTGSIAIRYGVSEPPETFLISPTGIILVKFIGPVTLNGLNSAIKRYQSS